MTSEVRGEVDNLRRRLDELEEVLTRPLLQDIDELCATPLLARQPPSRRATHSDRLQISRKAHHDFLVVMRDIQADADFLAEHVVARIARLFMASSPIGALPPEVLRNIFLFEFVAANSIKKSLLRLQRLLFASLLNVPRLPKVRLRVQRLAAQPGVVFLVRVPGNALSSSARLAA